AHRLHRTAGHARPNVDDAALCLSAGALSMRPTPVILAATLRLAIAFSVTWFVMRNSTTSNAAITGSAQSNDKDVLYWYDPMVPNQHFDKPGKSPFMDMQLVPKRASG